MEAAAELGDPVSAPGLAYLTAAYFADGNASEAAKKVKELSTAWPEYQAAAVLKRIFRHREHADAVLKPLFAAGWASPSIDSEAGASAAE